jgi:hypothetical protein
MTFDISRLTEADKKVLKTRLNAFKTKTKKEGTPCNISTMDHLLKLIELEAPDDYHIDKYRFKFVDSKTRGCCVENFEIKRVSTSRDIAKLRQPKSKDESQLKDQLKAVATVELHRGMQTGEYQFPEILDSIYLGM